LGFGNIPIVQSKIGGGIPSKVQDMPLEQKMGGMALEKKNT